MLRILEGVAPPSARPLVGSEPGYNIRFTEDGQMFARESRKRAKKAASDGVYTIGKSQFRIRKGAEIPEGAENIVYRDRDGVVTPSDVLSRRIVGDEETTSDDEESEKTSDDDLDEKTAKKTVKKS